ncbi:MAG: (Fe-S)-binding protein [Proteobacteria bacterium]|nr:(Fe-S)-binding protein [Pseudomonadota bacterium]
MRAIAGTASSTRHAACSGCSLCLLVCPVWRRSRDLALTPHGRAKALQNGVAVDDLADSADSCTLCGACRPVCPEQIDPVDLLIRLRRQLAPAKGWPALLAHGEADPAPQVYSRQVLLPGAALRAQPGRLAKVMTLLGTGLQVGADDGSDISLALEAGALLPQRRLERFLAPLRGSNTIIAADGLLCHYLAHWLPKAAILSLGQALSGQARVRSQLRATDLYVIEPRAYHANYQRLVKYYDRLRKERGCELNLDLQRIAIPATARSLSQGLGRIAPDDAAQIDWLLQGRRMSRIVVESLEDYAALAQASHCPVVHVADLVEDDK